MSLVTSVRHPRHIAVQRIACLLCFAALAVVALAACGGSSKPAYCSTRASLENSIKQVTSLSPSSGISALESAFTQVKADASKVVSQAKGDFPSETSAITSSVNSLESAVSSLRSNPSVANIATVAGAAGGVVSSFQGFLNATKSKCS